MSEQHRPTGRDEILDAVLDAADRLFARSSPTDVSLREIAREADVTYGLVHRHFGTKEQLIEQLLQRYQQRWLVRLEAEPSQGELLDYMLGPSPDTGANLRLVAWMLLSGKDATSIETHRRYVELDRLLSLPGRNGSTETGETGETTGTGDTGDAVATAASLAFIFGWRFFNPFIRAALPLDHLDTEQLQQAMHDELHRFTER